MNALRWQLPVYSPLPAASAWRTLLLGRGRVDDPRDRLRRALLDDYRGEAAVLCGSGTQALELALRVAAHLLGPGSVAAVPAFTCFSVATALVGADARIALYDLDPASLAPDFDSLERVLRAGARLVVVSPLFGMPIDWDTLERYASRWGAVVVEDAAQGHGAMWRERPLGSFGPLSVLSFGRGKGWTGGQGGALLLRGAAVRVAGEIDPQQGSAAGELRVCWSVVAQRTLGRPALYRIPASIPWLGLGETRYEGPRALRGLSRMAALVLELTRDAARREAERRRSNAATLLQRIPFGPAVRQVHPPALARPGFLRLPLRVAQGLAGFPRPRRAIRLGIAPAYPHPLHQLEPVCARLENQNDRWPGANDLTRELVTLPTHSLTTDAEREALVDAIRRYGSS